MSPELQYSDCDEDGYTPEERKAIKIPKWRQATTQFQVDLLSVFDMTYFPKEDRNAKTDVIEIERGMAPLAAIPNMAKLIGEKHPLLPYPKEWVDFGIAWTRQKRAEGKFITLRGLINFLKNRDRMIDWLGRNHKIIGIQEKKYETRPEVLEDRDAGMEEIYASYVN